jgi:hypothetical protein
MKRMAGATTAPMPDAAPTTTFIHFLPWSGPLESRSLTEPFHVS